LPSRAFSHRAGATCIAASIADAFFCPGLTRDQEDELNWPSESEAEANPDALPDAMLRGMKMQRELGLAGRATSVRARKVPLAECIGGAAILMSRHGISQRVIHRWPDQISHPINCNTSVAVESAEDRRA
jgi:hypothetical protein